MFAVLPAGRAVQTTFETVDSTHVVTTIAEADNINHIAVFLTGQEFFPEGLGGSVYFSWPEVGSSVPVSWQYLGFVSNSKPSTIFRLNKAKRLEQSHALAFGEVVTAHSHVAQIGISVESLSVIEGLSSISGVQPSNQDTFTQFVQKMLESFANYSQSFAVRQSEMVPAPNETFIPSSVVMKWYETFQQRFRLNRNFWRD